MSARTQLLADRYGRVARDMRVSVTDRCNLRCTYCMPAEGLEWLPSEQTLSDSEVIRTIGIAVERLGVRKVRFTGGEPLLRKGLESIIAATKQFRTDSGAAPETSLTTNGLGLDWRSAQLKTAGLDRVNVSLDSLDRERYAALSRRDRLMDVIRGLEAAATAGLTPVKVNSVIMRGVNEDDVVPLARFCLKHGYQLRFIEQMPLGPKHSWERIDMVTQVEILNLLGTEFRLSEHSEPRGTAPAELWRVEPDAGQPGGVIGVIASVTAPFCHECDRTRLTADGQMRSCLFSRDETDLRALLRTGATDDEIATAWRLAMFAKPAGHGIDDPDFEQPTRTMSAIGG